MDKDVLQARLSFSQDDLMIKKLKKDYSRISVLIVEYGETCKEHVESPQSRAAYWRGKLGY